jgi:hypothetical protein
MFPKGGLTAVFRKKYSRQRLGLVLENLGEA